MIVASAPRTNTQSQMHALNSIILNHERNTSDNETGVFAGSVEIHTVRHVVTAVIAVATNATPSRWIANLRKKRKLVIAGLGGLAASNLS